MTFQRSKTPIAKSQCTTTKIHVSWIAKPTRRWE